MRLRPVVLAASAAVILAAAVALSQPALRPGGDITLVSGTGIANRFTKWVNTNTVGNASMSDTVTPANKSVCFADGSGSVKALNCGDSGLQYTKGVSPTLNLIGTAPLFEVNSVVVLGGSKLSLLEAAAPSTLAGYDILYADSTAHRLKMFNNGGSADTVVGAATTDALSSKTLDNTNTITLKDTLFTLQDDGGTTRQAQFQLSSITAGQTRVMTVPDRSFTLAGVSGATTTGDYAKFDASGNIVDGGGVGNRNVALTVYAAPNPATSPNYGSLYGQGGLSGTESAEQSVAPIAGTAKNLRCKISVAPGGGKSWVITLRKNAADSLLTCTIADPATTCSDLSDSISVAAADLINFSLAPAGGPAATSLTCGMEMDV